MHYSYGFLKNTRSEKANYKMEKAEIIVYNKHVTLCDQQSLIKWKFQDGICKKATRTIT